MIKYFYFILFLFLFTSCELSYPVDTVPIDYLLHDNNSKVWLIKQHYIDGKDVVPQRFEDKKVIIFYSNGFYRMTQVKFIGQRIDKKESYYINPDSKELQLNVEDKYWIMQLKELSTDSLNLKATKKSDYPQDLVLIPFPEY